MAKRLFEEDGEWKGVARHATNEVTILLVDVLHKLEHELGDTVDLRDFHFIVNSALGGFVADLSIRRRLGAGDEQPLEILKGYPRLQPVYDD